jgi:threonine synthase
MINSINWARLQVQTMYYFLAFFRARCALPPDTDMKLVLPTGHFGDVLAGY